MKEQLERLQQNLERFTAVAKAATSGPWVTGHYPGKEGLAALCVSSNADGCNEVVFDCTTYMRKEDVEFICTFDPPTVLILLASVAQVQQVIEQAARMKVTLDEHRRKIKELEQFARCR